MSSAESLVDIISLIMHISSTVAFLGCASLIVLLRRAILAVLFSKGTFEVVHVTEVLVRVNRAFVLFCYIDISSVIIV